MNSFQSTIQSEWRIRSIRTFTFLLLFTSIFWICGTAAAEDDGGGDNDGFWYAITHGKPTIDMRLRIGIADADPKAPNNPEPNGLEQSEAYTLRTRLGYGTKPWHGGMLYAEAENTTAVATNQYNDGTEGAGTGQTIIADPTNIEVNQVYFKLKRDDWLGSSLILGRQRIKLDDDRFIGNVGWRQNEQTYDAVRGDTSLGVKNLNIMYAYQRYVRRIFGDQGPKARRDWRSNNHVINVSYDGLDWMKAVGFIYLLEFNKAAVNSSATYGFRLTGSPEIADKLKLIYEASYAYQTDYENNAVDYDAHYVMAKVKLAQSDLGAIGIGYELLGSDNGNARFVTPLATAHKFNGFSDVFLDNGGVNGLQDLFVSFSPKLPWKIKGTLVYHRFWSDQKSTVLGNEIDFVATRPINQYLSMLTKVGYFDSSDPSRPDLWRYTLEANLKF